MKKQILATGRLNDRADRTKLTSIHLDKEVIDWIEKNTKGNKQLIYNYLMKKGIEQYEQNKETIILEGLDDNS
ncbi:hypothetical protein CJF42_03595 [Pseudoalteromonas sp. NBT06-2]|uniref:hypothetical protein n=1 Tax=Pseudoalteromonas sp. NBT06-2 TaxID=2025950 RepID=UPI000BA5A2DC|nr:hypothetical protein [Pseudoalteromonas sp. NBT06-2]PAJ75727.1 hypothetical protein CJF42_03595 [Pseudoalteromonas sp. NBT06-2]